VASANGPTKVPPGRVVATNHQWTFWKVTGALSVVPVIGTW
jgi:hypothetical protein